MQPQQGFNDLGLYEIPRFLDRTQDALIATANFDFELGQKLMQLSSEATKVIVNIEAIGMESVARKNTIAKLHRRMRDETQAVAVKMTKQERGRRGNKLTLLMEAGSALQQLLRRLSELDYDQLTTTQANKLQLDDWADKDESGITEPISRIPPYKSQASQRSNNRANQVLYITLSTNKHSNNIK